MRFHLPLHLSRKRNLINLYLFEKDWQMAINQIECHPRECQIWSSQVGFFIGDHESRVLPIHIACSLHAPLEVVIAIVEANPSCLSAEENSLLQLPIHIACKFGAPVDVIEYLARKNVAGTMEPDVMSRLPIHYACSNGAPEAVRALLRVNSASTLCKDCKGWLPLHVAVSSASATMKTKKPSTTLKFSEKVQAKNRKEVIEMLKCAMVAETNDKRQYSSLRRVSKAA
mmetsp:Transcript_15/g.19  ORF Transcript_15/g.19 Transcript_15/m.19 type:complete len:228 (-) Transcript_15:509-1192(-)